MKNKNLKSQVHLVGSIHLSSAEEVFKLIGKKLSGCCHGMARSPDLHTWKAELGNVSICFGEVQIVLCHNSVFDSQICCQSTL